MTDKEALQRLLTFFYEDKGLEWSFIEGVTVGKYDKELEEYLIEHFKGYYD